MEEINVKLVVSIIGVLIFLSALMGRAFFSSISDIYVTPKIEMYIVKIVDVDKEESVITDREGEKYNVFTTKFAVETEDGVIDFTSHDYKLYKTLKANDKIQIYKYKDDYSLTQEEFSLPKYLKIVLIFLMFTGVAMGVMPWMPEDRNKYGTIDLWTD